MRLVRRSAGRRTGRDSRYEQLRPPKGRFLAQLRLQRRLLGAVNRLRPDGHGHRAAAGAARPPPGSSPLHPPLVQACGCSPASRWGPRRERLPEAPLSSRQRTSPGATASACTRSSRTWPSSPAPTWPAFVLTVLLSELGATSSTTAAAPKPAAPWPPTPPRPRRKAAAPHLPQGPWRGGVRHRYRTASSTCTATSTCRWSPPPPTSAVLARPVVHKDARQAVLEFLDPIPPAAARQVMAAWNGREDRTPNGRRRLRQTRHPLDPRRPESEKKNCPPPAAEPYSARPAGTR